MVEIKALQVTRGIANGRTTQPTRKTNTKKRNDRSRKKKLPGLSAIIR